MFFDCFGKDKNVIQIDHYYPLYYEILKNIVYHGLEGSWAVGHAKKHHKRLKQPMVSVEGCLLLIPRCHDLAKQLSHFLFSFSISFSFI